MKRMKKFKEISYLVSHHTSLCVVGCRQPSIVAVGSACVCATTITLTRPSTTTIELNDEGWCSGRVCVSSSRYDSFPLAFFFAVLTFFKFLLTLTYRLAYTASPRDFVNIFWAISKFLVLYVAN